jgi:sugar lactone lactonase YvrE
MKRLFCSLAVLALLLEAGGQVRSDFIYWTDNQDGHIWRANLDGSGQQSLISGLTIPVGLALDPTGGKMYYDDQGSGGSSYSANLDGSGPTTLVESLFYPDGIALDVPGSQMYWACGGLSSAGGIKRADLDGSGLTTLVSRLNGARGVALDVPGGKMYVSEGLVGEGTIRRYNLDGSGEEILIMGLPRPSAIALDLPGAKMYFGDQGIAGTVQRANLDGSGQEILVSRPGTKILGIALDLAGGKIYWTDYDSGKIERANLDGTGQETLLGGLTGPSHIALQIELAPGNRFQITAASTAVSGTPFDVSITALDANGNIDTNYQGTVTFTSSDAYPGLLPADYTFTSADQGTHTFSGGVTLYTAGTQSLTVQDTADSSITGSFTVGVVAAPASQLLITAPANAVSGTPFDVILMALDPYANVDMNYGGTVTWTSSDTDPGVLLPPDYTFQATDNGMVTFSGGVTLITLGNQTLTAADTLSGISGSATIVVGP